jgi:hypothetical protein
MNKDKKNNIEQFDSDGNLYCNTCQKYKPFERFYSDKKKKYRNCKGTQCADCRKIYMRKRYEKKIEIDSFGKCINNM